MANERIKLNMTMQEIVFAMSEGNPGAMTVLSELIKHGQQIDPDSFAGSLSSILHMDTLKIYGPRIWGLYKNVCGKDLMKTVAVLRAHQLGQLAGVTEEALSHAIDHYGEGLDVDAAVMAVKEQLPNFGVEQAA